MFNHIQSQEDLFASQSEKDIEDIAGTSSSSSRPRAVPTVTVSGKRKRDSINVMSDDDLNKSWKEVLGEPPSMGNSKVINYK